MDEIQDGIEEIATTAAVGPYEQCCGAGPLLTGSGPGYFFFTGSGSGSSSYKNRLKSS